MDQFFNDLWNILTTLLDPRNLTNPVAFQKALNQPGVFWAAFTAVNLIIFTETGLLAGFLLPGDSLLVVLGLVSYLADWNVWLLAVSLSLAAIIGDSVGYWIGSKAGPAIFRRPDGRFFKQAYLQRAREFYERHGGKTIIIARFIPIIRTFVPVVAGAAKMNYRWFLFYNIFGGFLWIFSMLLLGYYLVPVADPWIQQALGKPDFTIAKHIDKLALTVIFVSIAPMLWKGFQEWRKRKRAAEPTTPTTV